MAEKKSDAAETPDLFCPFMTRAGSDPVLCSSACAVFMPGKEAKWDACAIPKAAENLLKIFFKLPDPPEGEGSTRGRRR